MIEAAPFRHELGGGGIASGSNSPVRIELEMAWQEHALRLIRQGLLSPAGEPLDHRVLVRIVTEIGENPELAERLDTLDQEGVRAELIARSATRIRARSGRTRER